MPLPPLYLPAPATWALLLAASWALFGLIWMVQLVHYPTFRLLEGADFAAFHRHHTTSISLIVAPLMLLELALALWLVWQSGGHWHWLVPLVLVVLIWAHTFLFAIPLHNELGLGLRPEAADRLVRINWWRTVLWTVKAGWVTWLFCGE